MMWLALIFSATVFAHTEVVPQADGTYTKVEREYVVAASKSVEALCEAGDTLVEGSCSQPDRFQSVILDGQELKTSDRAGWVCAPRLVRTGQVIKVESTVICKKPNA